jgi:hypothetical protein
MIKFLPNQYEFLGKEFFSQNSHEADAANSGT